MKYACLVYVDPNDFAALSDDERATLDRESYEYDQELMRSGHYIAASALQRVHTATTIRVRGGKVLSTDGPFAETKEVLCGFIFVDVPDRETAIRIAEGVPMARYGSIELRQERG